MKRIYIKLTLSISIFLVVVLFMASCGESSTIFTSNNTDDPSESFLISSDIPYENAHTTTANTDSGTDDIQIIEKPKNINPTIVVNNAICKAGDTGVKITIEIQNNPTIMGMDFDVYYDESTMKLSDAKSELNAVGVSYTYPSYFRNPTTFLWDFQDATWTNDGVFLTLYFDVFESADEGSYDIKILYSYGNIYNELFDSLELDIENGFIEIKK